MSDLNLKLTQTQYRLLLELSQSIPAVFVGESEDQDNINYPPTPTLSVPESGEPEVKLNPSSLATYSVDMHPELRVSPGAWTKVDLVFKIGQIGMELFECDADKPVGDLHAASLSRAYLDNTNLKLRMISDGSMESELLINSFNIKDSRRMGTNKFRNIMSSSNTDGSQFMASVTISGGTERNLVALLTVDSPRIIFALDYIFALKDFVMEGLAKPAETLDIELSEASDSEDSISISAVTSDSARNDAPRTKSQAHKKTPQQSGRPMNISYRVNVVDSQVILIANPSSSSSEAIVLGTKQVLLSQQHALTLQISQVGMFLCRMDKFDENRLRVLDDFNLNISLDNKDLGLFNTMTSITVNIDPLVLRVSLRDILLATQIMAKASEMSQPKDKTTDTTAKATPIKGGAPGKRPPTDRVSSAVKRKTKSLTTAKSAPTSQQKSPTSPNTVRREELKAEIAGVRVILIGDTHELPLLDVSVKHFTVKLKDWTGEVSIILTNDSKALYSLLTDDCRYQLRDICEHI